MTDDPRCCGSGTCIINADGECWCGQRWDGQRMCRVTVPARSEPARPDAASQADADAPSAAD